MNDKVKRAQAHEGLRVALGKQGAVEAFLDVARAYDPDGQVNARSLYRAVNAVCYFEFDTYPQGIHYPAPAAGDEIRVLEPFVRGALSNLQGIAALYDTPAYRPLANANVPRNFAAAIESAWTKMIAGPSLSA